jgi:hypothetical protein
MKTIRDLLLFALMAVVLTAGSLIIGCAAAPQPNPVERIEAPMKSGQAHVQAADAQLAKTPPAVPAARVELKQADKDLTQAIKETKAVKEEVGDALEKLANREKEIKDLKESFFSPKQKHLFWFGIGISVLLGILAAVGNVRPGWWSLPALWAIKAVRFVLFAGIPHVISVIRWLIKEVSEFRAPAVASPPAPATLPA